MKGEQKPRLKENRRGIWGWIDPKGHNLEKYAYTLHRGSGLLMVGYLFLHIYVTGFRLGGPEMWESIMATLANPFVHVFEFILFSLVAYHGFNGIRLILAELGLSIGTPKRPVYPYKPSSLSKHSRVVLGVFMIIATIFIIGGALEFLLYSV